jgi:hypothetical protein
MKEELIERAIDEFDFEKVHGVMELLKWKWYNHAENKVPTIDEMKKCIRDLYKDCDGENSVCTGGFSVQKYMEDDIEWVSISFTLEHSETN